ncbi:MAG: type I DNA topoisomerase [Christensenellaceae bacterium]|jgi:DNA topoisomerase-1|nr:type I DNA topoisomerase [Christensenellaceae bacterium]
MILVIIEGIGKKDTIKKYLGAGYDVMATGGHFRDLPEGRGANGEIVSGVGADYNPRYVVSSKKKDLVKSLKEKAEKAEDVLIATDPDREGEAIGWHLAHVLGLKPEKAHRIEFNEITKSAVTKAVGNPRAIDVNLVNAQQARRVLDRLVGYKLSPVVSKKIKPKLSAGRVQSVTLKLVVVREREIQNFKPEEYWDFGAKLEKDKADFLANIVTGIDGKKIKITSKEQCDKVIDDIKGAKYTVKEVRKSITKKHAPAPYTTSSMQQDALNKAGLNLKRCGMAAQEMYQGIKMGDEGNVALITYIRTDSVRVAPEAQTAARETITERYGEKFLPHDENGVATFNFYKSKKSAQDAHEAIRPTHLEITPDKATPFLSPDQVKLYRLIYNRFLASQMAEATFNSVSVDIDANSYGFRATGRTPIFDCWITAYGGTKNQKKDEDENEEEKESNVTLPELNEGDVLKFLKLEFAQKFTKPPARYTEATLVKAMEDAGIGRPATYNPIIQNIASRFYTERDGKAIKPTELGFVVVDLLEKYFKGIMDVEFTSGMEEKLDDIAYQGLDWVKVIDDFYKPFVGEIAIALEGQDNVRIELEVTEVPCSKCGKMMVVRQGRFGKFIACPGFPDCRNILPYDKPVGKCPKCNKDVYKRKSKKGRVFYGCSGYPDCDYVTWDAPKESN